MSGKYVRILMEVIIFLLSCMKLKKQILTKFQNGISKKLTGKNFNILCHEKLMFDNFENSEDPILSFTETLLDISNRCIPKSSTNSFTKKKPWFNDECKEAIKKRKDSLKRFKQYPTKIYLNACKILRAKARRIIKQAKRSSWKDLISKINARTPMTTIWNMIKKINGKKSKHERDR